MSESRPMRMTSQLADTVPRTHVVEPMPLPAHLADWTNAPNSADARFQAGASSVHASQVATVLTRGMGQETSDTAKLRVPQNPLDNNQILRFYDPTREMISSTWHQLTPMNRFMNPDIKRNTVIRPRPALYRPLAAGYHPEDTHFYPPFGRAQERSRTPSHQTSDASSHFFGDRTVADYRDWDLGSDATVGAHVPDYGANYFGLRRYHQIIHNYPIHGSPMN